MGRQCRDAAGLLSTGVTHEGALLGWMGPRAWAAMVSLTAEDTNWGQR